MTLSGCPVPPGCDRFPKVLHQTWMLRQATTVPLPQLRWVSPPPEAAPFLGISPEKNKKVHKKRGPDPIAQYLCPNQVVYPSVSCH
jgi:hypothetical protein